MSPPQYQGIEGVFFYIFKAITNTNFSEKITTSYDLADNVLSKTRTHKPNATTTRTITETMDYDNGLRLKQNKHKVDNEAEQALSYLDYTIKNQVQTKSMGKVGSLNYLQKVDYQYNSMGWLTGINTPTLNGSTNAVCALPFANTNGTLDENDLFSMDMRYENPTAAYTPTGTSATAQYGGNISQMVWQVRGKQKQVYTFQYDHLSRITEANYSELNASNVKIDDANKYMEKLTYDMRGNIKILQRNGMTGSCTFGQIDNLSYFYNNNDTEASDIAPKNRLRKVTESSLTTKGFKRQGAGGDYTYDANGNLRTDPNKGITLIEYNHLNLPTQVTFTNGNVIQWLYDASGAKLRKTTIAPAATITLNGQPLAPGAYISTGLLTSTGTVSANTTVTMKGRLGVELLPNFEAQSNSNFEAVQDVTITGDVQDYVGGIEYKNANFSVGTPMAEAIYHAEGRVIMMNGLLKYEYALKDHLGNTRLMFCDKSNNGVITQSTNQEDNEVSQELHFYPFGMAMEGTWSNTPLVNDSKYQFGGKELNSDFGLEWMDFGARQYDAALGRWLSVDPMADLAPNLTTYRYGFNNPVRFTDPNGMYESGNAAYDDVSNRMRELAEKENNQRAVKKKIDDAWNATPAGENRAFNSNGDYQQQPDPYEGWEDLTKDKLKEYAEGQANHCHPCDDNQLGDFFMDIFSENVRGMDGFRKADLSDKSEDGGIRNTIPDFTANASYNVGYFSSKKVPKGVWYELKAKNGNLFRSSDLGGQFGVGQIEGHITNLAAKFATLRALTNGAFIPALYIVTTADVGVSPVLKLIAIGQGVNLIHIHSFYKIDQSGKWHFAFLPPKARP